MIVAHDHLDAREHPLHRIRQLVGSILEACNWHDANSCHDDASQRRLFGRLRGRLCGCLRGRPKQLLTRHLTSAATVWRRIISDAASARTKYITHRRNLSHLDAGTATHASPGLSDDVFSEVTAPAVILLRGCLNFTEGGLGDESIIQQGLGYVEVHLEVPLPLCHALQRDATTWRRGQRIIQII